MTSRGPRTILIVDDQPGNVHLLAAALRDGFDLRFATSGARALDLIHEEAIDLVLLDVAMPDMDGLEVCRRIKNDERTAAIPVVFVTAREEVEDEARGFEAGGVDYITKPISPLIVQARVRTHLELKENRDLLEELSLRDPLTGIANRRRFDEVLEREWRRSLRGLRWISIGLADVDEFKKYNDALGHPQGDECLRTVARVLASSVRRPGDLVARYGGEEFGLILPETDGPGMQKRIREILRDLGHANIPHPASSSGDRVTVSIGAVSLVPMPTESASGFVAAADRLLYESKQQGRNQGVHLDVREGAKARIDARASSRVV